jgi:hypothetical protein
MLARVLKDRAVIFFDFPVNLHLKKGDRFLGTHLIPQNAPAEQSR